MSKIISISIDEESLRDFDEIVEALDSDRSKTLRKWIRENKGKPVSLNFGTGLEFET